MKTWVAFAGWVGAVLRFVPVEFDVLRFWNSVRFALALQAPASLHCVCVGFGPGLRGGARGPFIRRWILPPLVAFRMFWIGFRGFQIGFGVGGFGVGFKVMALGFNVLGQWFGVQGPGFMVLGLGFTVLGTGFEGLGLGFDVGVCLRLLGLGFPNSWRNLEPQTQKWSRAQRFEPKCPNPSPNALSTCAQVLARQP